MRLYKKSTKLLKFHNCVAPTNIFKHDGSYFATDERHIIVFQTPGLHRLRCRGEFRLILNFSTNNRNEWIKRTFMRAIVESGLEKKFLAKKIV